MADHLDPAALRRDYARHGKGLTEADLAPTWHQQLDAWFAEAVADPRVSQPHAVVLATASAAGVPSVRTVLLKGWDERGLTFATNRLSAKGNDLEANPVAALCLSWVELERQVIVQGPVEHTSEAESDAIFAARPPGAQWAAWASRQSAVVASRAALEAQRADAERQWPAEVPRPPHWGGYRVRPLAVEVWQGRPDRLHDRLRWRRDAVASADWVLERLQP